MIDSIEISYTNKQILRRLVEERYLIILGNVPGTGGINAKTMYTHFLNEKSLANVLWHVFSKSVRCRRCQHTNSKVVVHK